MDVKTRLLVFQLDQVEKILEDLSSCHQDSSDSDSDTEVQLDEEDEQEREKLSQYINRFKVCLKK